MADSSSTATDEVKSDGSKAIGGSKATVTSTSNDEVKSDNGSASGVRIFTPKEYSEWQKEKEKEKEKAQKEKEKAQMEMEKEKACDRPKFLTGHLPPPKPSKNAYERYQRSFAPNPQDQNSGGLKARASTLILDASTLEKKKLELAIDALKSMASLLGVRMLTPTEWEEQKQEKKPWIFNPLLNKPSKPEPHPDDEYFSQIVEGEVFDINDFPGSSTPTKIISMYDGGETSRTLAGVALEDFNSRHGVRYELVKVIMVHCGSNEREGWPIYFITFNARKAGADPEDSLTKFQARVCDRGWNSNPSLRGRKVEHCAIKKSEEQKHKSCACEKKPCDCPSIRLAPMGGHKPSNCFPVMQNHNVNQQLLSLAPKPDPDQEVALEKRLEYFNQIVEGEVFDIKDFPGSFTPTEIISMYDGGERSRTLAGAALEDFNSRHGVQYELVKVIMVHYAFNEQVRSCAVYFITFNARKAGANPEDSLTTFQARVCDFGGWNANRSFRVTYKVEHCAIRKSEEQKQKSCACEKKPCDCPPIKKQKVCDK